MQHYPGGGDGGGFLPGHEERDHHVRDFGVRKRRAVFVAAGHEVPQHVFAVFGPEAARSDDVRVHFGHFSVGHVALALVGEWEPGDDEVDGGETLVKSVVEGEEGLV